MKIQTYGKLLLRLPPPQPHALDLHNEGSLPLDQGLLQMGVKFGTKDARIPSCCIVLQKCLTLQLTRHWSS